jgi:hypothetical protein
VGARDGTDGVTVKGTLGGLGVMLLLFVWVLGGSLLLAVSITLILWVFGLLTETQGTVLVVVWIGGCIVLGKFYDDEVESFFRAIRRRFTSLHRGRKR